MIFTKLKILKCYKNCIALSKIAVLRLNTVGIKAWGELTLVMGGDANKLTICL